MQILIKSIKIKASEIRKQRKDKREPCYICNDHILVTEKHHLVSLKECAYLFNGSGNVNVVANKLVWLCPTHHKYIHLLFDNKTLSIEKTEQILAKFSKEEIQKIDNLDLMRKTIFDNLKNILKVKARQFLIENQVEIEDIATNE